MTIYHEPHPLWLEHWLSNPSHSPGEHFPATMCGLTNTELPTDERISWYPGTSPNCPECDTMVLFRLVSEET